MAITLVGNVGTIATAAAATVSPVFTQPTTLGNLLVAWIVESSGTAAITTVAAGWVVAKNIFASITGEAAIWYKPNCAGGEAAPTFTSTSATFMAAQLCEFSGAITASPVDKTGSSQGTTSATLAVTNASADSRN